MLDVRKLFFALFLGLICSSVFTQDAFAQDITPCRVDFNKNGEVDWDDFAYAYTQPTFDVLMDIAPDPEGFPPVNYVDIALFGTMVGETYILGDYNYDGCVDGSDLLTFLAAFGEFEPCVDLSGDGFVTAQDLSIFLGYFGTCEDDEEPPASNSKTKEGKSKEEQTKLRDRRTSANSKEEID